MGESVNQTPNNKPWLWKPGQSGNLRGRPKGRSLKEWTRNRIAKMTDEERVAFLNAISPELAWKMAEGSPKEETNLELTRKPIVLLPERKNDRTNNGNRKTPKVKA